MSVHERLDLDHWLETFSLQDMIDEKRALGAEHKYEVPSNWLPGGAIISSPVHLAKVEHTRRALIERGHDLGPSKPVDIFLWRVSEYSRGPVTRIGGLPFRDPQKPWPTTPAGGMLSAFRSKRRLPFLAQISFLDSKDILPGDLPGDVLCIYGEWTDRVRVDTDTLAFEWVLADKGEDASIHETISLREWPFCAEGVIHRSVCYPECYDLLLELDINSPYSLNCFQATSIGGTPHVIQNDPQDLDQIVATFSSFQASKTWPFVNCAESPRYIYPKGHEGVLNSLFEMMVDDMGCMYTYRDNRGKYRHGQDSY